MDFPEKLRMLIKHTRHSQESVGEALGVSQNLVSRWSRGKNNPDIYQAYALSRLFGVTLDYLANPDDDRSAAVITIEMHARSIAARIGWDAVYDRLIGADSAGSTAIADDDSRSVPSAAQN